METIKCNKCGSVKNKKDVDKWTSKEGVIYECIDRKQCSRNKFDGQRHAQEKDNKTKEEKLKEKYGLKMQDLTEIEHRFRDASVHYLYDNNIISWNLHSKVWYQPDENNKAQILAKLKNDDE